MSVERPSDRTLTRAVAVGGARLLRSRALMRAPIWAYRARLGFVFGSRMLMLEHIGRTSGTRRRVVLEVFDHPEADSYVVVSGFGTRAQWFRNIRANPAVRVHVSGGPLVPATARILDQDEADRALASYTRRHPDAWATFRPVLEATLGAPIDVTNTALPMVGLRLDRSRFRDGVRARARHMSSTTAVRGRAQHTSADPGDGRSSGSGA